MGKLTISIEINSTDWTSGDRDSCQQEQIDSVVSPPLVQKLNGKIDAQSGISKLPVELLSLIFHHCNSALGPRLVLTHTCHRWRHIAIRYPSLWTILHIEMRDLSIPARFKCFESLLSMQVDRSGGLPLDVVCILDISGSYATLALITIRRKAPFSRWRSLELCMEGENLRVESMLSAVVLFPNLESLTISGRTNPVFTRIFRGAPMPKLKTLNLRYALTAHPLPNIQNYRLYECHFCPEGPIDLHTMTSLIISGFLNVHDECEVLLPALQYLRFMAMHIYPGSKIEAPVLRNLHLSASIRRGDPYHISSVQEHMENALNSAGYRLSPKELIIEEPYLSKGLIIGILKKSPELTQATICFSDRESAQTVVETLLGFGTRTSSLDERLCPQLAELMLDWWDADTALSAEQWLRGLEARRTNPPRSRVSVKARRKGEEWYRLLVEL
jgi:hypothetical protein